MNANELADELCFAEMDSDEIETWAKNARDMLRQQQAEIERLIGSKPITYGMLTFCKNCGEQNPYQSKTLTDEEYKPLAEEDAPYQKVVSKEITDEINKALGLKTLTDEEIQELAFEYLEKTDKGIVGVYDFVRAILQKANNG